MSLDDKLKPVNKIEETGSDPLGRLLLPDFRREINGKISWLRSYAKIYPVLAAKTAAEVLRLGEQCRSLTQGTYIGMQNAMDFLGAIVSGEFFKDYKGPVSQSSCDFRSYQTHRPVAISPWGNKQSEKIYRRGIIYRPKSD